MDIKLLLSVFERSFCSNKFLIFFYLVKIYLYKIIEIFIYSYID